MNTNNDYHFRTEGVKCFARIKVKLGLDQKFFQSGKGEKIFYKSQFLKDDLFCFHHSARRHRGSSAVRHVAFGGGVRARASSECGRAPLLCLLLCTGRFIPTEAGRWDPRKGRPASKGRWVVRAAASPEARWEAPRSSTPSSYLRHPLFPIPLLSSPIPFCPISLCGGSCGFLGPRCHWIGFMESLVGLIGGRRGRRCHHFLCDSHRPPSRPRAARPLAPPHSSPPEQLSSAGCATDVLYCTASLL
jgi:hypothetical protein